jgi:hypothetical protein
MDSESDTRSCVSWRDDGCTSVSHWLAKNGCCTKSSSATHLDLSGGMYVVADKSPLLVKFFEMVARDIRGGVPFFLCEKRPEISPFYLDFDYSATEPLSREDVLTITFKVQAALYRFYPEMEPGLWRSRGMAAVLFCEEPTRVVVQKRDFVKTGVHIIFPNLFVTEEQCVSLAQYVIQYLMVHQPQHQSMLPWASVIDLAVYGHGKSLRMLGASKCVKCAVCCKKSTMEKRLCEACQGRSFSVVGAGRKYYPAWIIEGGDSIPASNTPRFINSLTYALSLCSIACTQARPVGGYTVPADFVPLQRRTVASLGRILANEIPASDPRVAVLQNLICSLGVYEWRQIRFSRVLYSGGKKESYLCQTIGLGLHFCRNVMRDHSSSTIYFTVTRRGIVQRCHSSKPAAAGAIGCATYASYPEPIRDMAATMVLFPMLNAVGSEIDESYCAANGNSWGGNGMDPELRSCVLRRRRILNRLATVIPPPKKRIRVATDEEETFVPEGRGGGGANDEPESDEERIMI